MGFKVATGLPGPTAFKGIGQGLLVPSLCGPDLARQVHVCRLLDVSP